MRETPKRSVRPRRGLGLHTFGTAVDVNSSNKNELAAHMAKICRDTEDIHRCVQPRAVMELQGAKRSCFANPYSTSRDAIASAPRSGALFSATSEWLPQVG